MTKDYEEIGREVINQLKKTGLRPTWDGVC